MRILIYLEQESWGGVDTHLLSLLTDWPDKSDRITLVSNENNKGFERKREHYDALDNVSTATVDSLSHNLLLSKWRQHKMLRAIAPVLHFLQPVTYLLGANRFVRRIKTFGQFDVALSINGGYPAAWGTISFLEAARIVGIESRFLLVHHAATKPLPFMNWFEQIIDRRLSLLANALITVSRATHQSLVINRYLKDEQLHLPVIHNQVTKISDDNAAIDLRDTIDARDNHIVIGVMGRIESYKGHADLIVGISGLEPLKRDRVKLAIFGTGDDAEIKRLKSLARRFHVEENVCWMGFVDGEPSKIINQMDLLAMVTRSFEGYGLTIVEAMHAGTPVIATDVGAVREFVNEANGTLIPPCDPQAITSALNEFFDSPELFQKRSVVARRQVAGNASEMATSYRRLMLMYCDRES